MSLGVGRFHPRKPGVHLGVPEPQLPADPEAAGAAPLLRRSYSVWALTDRWAASSVRERTGSMVSCVLVSMTPRWTRPTELGREDPIPRRVWSSDDRKVADKWLVAMSDSSCEDSDMATDQRVWWS